MPSFLAQIPLSLYIHIPWCVRKCPYCDFNSHTAKQDLPEAAYVEALLQEVDSYLPLIANRPIISIFFGGGTPSLFSGNAITTLLQKLREKLTFTKDIEITLEANPGTVDENHFQTYYQAGVNRLSIGVQSLDDEHLKKLGRIHDTKQVASAIAKAARAGFSNFNIDLMYGLSMQTIPEALSDLEKALQFNPTHLSWYQLTIEPNTLFYRQTPPLPSDELIYDMQLSGQALLAKAQFQQYEVSAYAKNNNVCRHNTNYWSFGDYLGIGAGAHSKLTLDNENIIRFSQVKHPKDYLQIEKRLKPKQHCLTKKDKLFEFMLNGLRLTEGINQSLLPGRTGLLADEIAPLVTLAINKGLLENHPTHYRPTAMGQRFLNDLVAIFLQ